MSVMTVLAFAESIQLVPDGTLFLHIAIILLMIFVLNKTLFKPINRVLDERERRTRGRSAEAQDILHRVGEKVTSYERSLREARAESYRLLESQRAEAMRARQSVLNGVREEATHSIEEQKNAIRAQADEARVTLKEEAYRVAASISTHIMGRPTSGSPQSGVGV